MDLVEYMMLGRTPVSVRSALNRLPTDHIGRIDDFGLPQGYRRRQNSQYSCNSCGVDHDNLIIQKPLWLSVVDKAGIDEHEVLCCSCMERFLGRKLLIEDLEICPGNRQFFLGWKNGVDNG